jgi:tRNA(adenine34) deaminase
VVWGAADPKTGANGSVIDVFMDRRLNHHTQAQGGVLDAECAGLLAGFFKVRRAQSRHSAQPLRDDALRTPEARFESLPSHGARSVFIDDLPALAGLRLHCIDDGPNDAPRTWLCLHGATTWSHAFRHMIPPLLAAGDRVVAPDLIGFGRSDKPKREDVHRFEWHRDVLLQLVEHLDLRHVVVVAQDRALGLGVSLALALPERFEGLVSIPLSKSVDSSIDDAPFPDRGHRAALRARPFDATPGEQQRALDQQLDDLLHGRWRGPHLVLDNPLHHGTEPGDEVAAVAMRHFPRG